MIAKGGKAVYGARVGILMLEARFPRIVGDMGNAETWPFPVRYKVVRGASPDLVVRQGAPGLLEPFIAAGRELVKDGVELITTNCGFLSLFQAELSEALQVPVATSALMQARAIQATLPRGKVLGILTISGETLTERHLRAADVPDGTRVRGISEQSELYRVILGNELRLDTEKARSGMVEAALGFQSDVPELGALLFECTNMPPYAAAVGEATGLPVYSMETYLHWLVKALP